MKAQGRTNLANGISLDVSDDPRGSNLEFASPLVRARNAVELIWL